MTIRSFCKVDIRFVRFRAKNGDHTKDPEILRKWETCGTNNKKNSGYRWIQIDEGGRIVMLCYVMYCDCVVTLLSVVRWSHCYNCMVTLVSIVTV